MDAARSEADLRDLEAATLAQQDVLLGHADILELDVHVAARRVIMAEDAHWPEDLHARRFDGHQDLRLLELR